METTSVIDVEPIAKHLKLELDNVRRTTELLEEGNTVPFITRFRKDHTGGLDEQQVRAIEKELNREKLLVERKETILKSIESRGQLTEELAHQIRGARTLGTLEDIYLPYKPKKQSLASLARSKGLEPLATEIINGTTSTESLQDRASALIDETKELPTVDAVLDGVQHLIAEHFCNHPKLRSQLRRHLWRGGNLVSRKIEEPEQSDESSVVKATIEDSDSSAQPSVAGQSEAAAASVEDESKPAESADTLAANELVESESSIGLPADSETDQASPTADETATPEASSAVAAPEEPASATATDVATPQESASAAATDVSTPEESASATATDVATPQESASAVATDVATPEEPASATATDVATPQESASATATDVATPEEPASATATDVATPEEPASATATDVSTAEEPAPTIRIEVKPTGAATEGQVSEGAQSSVRHPVVEKKKKEATARRDQRRETRRRRRERLVQSFKDYFDFSDPIGRVPHHRILAINRGERTKVLRVKVECPDWDKFQAEAEASFIPPEHPHAGFLKKCLHYALSRLLLPSIEREVRRELNDKAEEHAVSVFARNLRKLLLQPPLCQHRIVAIDPGFRSGCKLVALDEFGSVLGHTFINLLGKEQQKQDGRTGLINFAREHKATAIAIGNGAACRETEALVADVLTNVFKDQDVGYLIVNEAGTSVYSTSDLGREELPNHDATVRSAVSIGRRALDPLSELVKIDPASIGVGLYQHDVKAKHLQDSLDAVVESCVNYVGVDVNSASPALLRYVSGLNSLTARRIFEYRQQNGPFKNREQLKEVTGIGNSTYVQAAGFLKVVDGEHPLDETWIHPESYPIATKVLDAIGFRVSDLRSATRPTNVAARLPEVPADGETETDVTTDEGPRLAESTEKETADAATSEIEKADVALADVATTEAAVPDAIAPDAITPDAITPDAITPDAITPDAITPDAATPDAATPDAATPDAATPDAATPDAATPETIADVATDDKKETDSVSDPEPGESALASSPPSASPAEGRRSSGPAQELLEKLANVDVGKLAPEMGVGRLLLEDILKALARPGRDPREDLPPPMFRRGILKLEDLKPGMELSGTVLNVVDFGAFVDIGLVDSGLIHVSRLADRFISDPHDVVSVGDILRVWVVEVDQKRRRVSLTAIEPGTERPKPTREKRKPKEARSGGRPQPGKGRANKGKKFTRSGEQKPNQYKPKARPKPVVPITKEMEEGKEPMRTFGDLKQLFEKKKKGGSD